MSNRNNASFPRFLAEIVGKHDKRKSMRMRTCELVFKAKKYVDELHRCTIFDKVSGTEVKMAILYRATLIRRM